MRTALSLGRTAFLFGLLATSLRAADEPKVIELWPDKVPGETAPIEPEKATPSKTQGRPPSGITNVSKPTITVYRPAKEKDTGVAVLIAPGGGYNMLAYDHEGVQVAEWLNSLGVTGVVLKYRVPRRPDQPRDRPPTGALQDAQRAMSLIRDKAESWGIDPHKIGMLGFSAGGHLTAWTSTNFDKRAYDAIDDADRASSRPDFAVLVYPGGVQSRTAPDRMNDEIRISSETPPCFFVHAGDDRVSSENSALMYIALKRAGVPAEMHIYSAGGHGFGLGRPQQPVATWPQRCAEWMKAQKLFEPLDKTAKTGE